MTFNHRAALMLAAMLGAAMAGPAVSQGPPAAAASGSERMADARGMVDAVYPAGSYAATIRAAMRDMADKQAGNEEVRKLDPHSAERMRITYKIIDEEAAKLGREQELAVREAMIQAAMAKFSDAELRDIRAFLETPSGRAYVSKAPQVSAVLETPEQQARMMVAIESMATKIEAATAHLPQP
jgi:hypothetical protein